MGANGDITDLLRVGHIDEWQLVPRVAFLHSAVHRGSPAFRRYRRSAPQEGPRRVTPGMSTYVPPRCLTTMADDTRAVGT